MLDLTLVGCIVRDLQSNRFYDPENDPYKKRLAEVDFTNKEEADNWNNHERYIYAAALASQLRKKDASISKDHTNAEWLELWDNLVQVW